jgi:MFS family permease
VNFVADIEISSQYAQVMGIVADLHLQGDDVSNAASAFYIAALVAVVPNGMSDRRSFQMSLRLTRINLQSTSCSGSQSAFGLPSASSVSQAFFVSSNTKVGGSDSSSQGWGICVASHAAAQNYTGLIIVRVLSGLFEAGIPSCLLLVTGQYYTRKEQPVRFSIWYCGFGLGQIFGGLISWGAQHIPAGAPLASWRVM